MLVFWITLFVNSFFSIIWKRRAIVLIYISFLLNSFSKLLALCKHSSHDLLLYVIIDKFKIKLSISKSNWKWRNFILLLLIYLFIYLLFYFFLFIYVFYFCCGFSLYMYKSNFVNFAYSSTISKFSTTLTTWNLRYKMNDYALMPNVRHVSRNCNIVTRL